MKAIIKVLLLLFMLQISFAMRVKLQMRQDEGAEGKHSIS